MSERKITMKGDPLTLVGPEIKPGDDAPDVTLLSTGLEPVSLSSFKGSVVVLCAVPSLDTSVCDIEMQRFNKEAANMGDAVKVVCVSADLPFAQSRWCGATGSDAIVALSDYKGLNFAKAYGVEIKELALLGRAVFVVDKAGDVKYVEIVEELASEPNYEAALAAVKEAL